MISSRMEFDPISTMYELPRKPKFEKDFIMLSEFSELVGPMPVVSCGSSSLNCTTDPVLT